MNKLPASTPPAFPLGVAATAWMTVSAAIWALTLVLVPGATPAHARPAATRPAPPSVCGQQVGAFRFALNDLQRGHAIEPSTYATILAELGPVADACREGDEVLAGRLLRALERRWRFR